MNSKHALLLLCFVVTAKAMNLKQNVLYFQAHDEEQAASRNIGEITTNLVGNNTCPDPKSFCSSNYTCCKGPTNGTAPPIFVCCPFQEGVCCLDGQHCCPRGSHCDMVKRQCYWESEQGDIVIADWNNLSGELSNYQPSLGDVPCGDGTSCPDGNTCCQLASGQYGCCPLPQAVCCSDHTHCCPNGYTCDVSAGTCTKENDVITWLSKQPSRITNVQVTLNDVPCGDGSSCPDGNTCCQLASGEYGCCPLPQAVCCSDHAHCCPNGYTCDVSAGTCTKENDVMTWLTKIPARKITNVQVTSNVNDVPCGDGSSCPDGNTCCQLASGEYGCCPLPQAVCCSDHAHCCPNGYTCDVSAGTCTKGSHIMAWLAKNPARISKVKVAFLENGEMVTSSDVPCGDGSSCPDGNTCCQLASGEYGCCPLPQAVCCSDHAHCCPNGYTCDVSAGTCTKESDVIIWLTKNPAKYQVTSGDVPCGDGTSCPDGNTCCQLASGQYGCCPLPQAVCCSDHTHCCPNGYTCDVSAGTCTKESNVMTWLSKKPAKRTKPSLGLVYPTSNVNDVPCGDGSSCPDGNTCCQLASGEYGCCPLPQAVCCSDHTHCCPNGYTCDVSAGTCTKGNHITAWLTKNPAKMSNVQKKLNDVPCGDGTSCPDGNTCCQLASGQYGCCPLPQAVCCSDHTHCCPNGYTCDISAGTCTKESNTIKLLTKVSAKPAEQSVKCGDNSECPAGSSCCDVDGSQYGCCPVQQAVCCSDHTHCCPNGYMCDISAATCTKGNDIVAWFRKVWFVPKLQVAVVCPDGKSQCSDGTTCCKTSTGVYSCCPHIRAVCCSDHLHCCPEGYKCGGAGKCTKVIDAVQWFPISKIHPTLSSFPCGEETYCHDGYTCCIMTGGRYGCCIYPQAVCCSDHVHCCPKGFTCHLSEGICVKKTEIVNWLTKVPAKPVLQSVTCADGSECPDGSTCCDVGGGQYGCCPLPEAVCCSDHSHCCPNGYTCDVSAGTCTKERDVIAWLSKEPAVKTSRDKEF